NSAEGAEIILNVLEQGDLFGEVGLARRQHADGERGGDGAGRPAAHSPRPFSALCQGQSRSYTGNADVAVPAAALDQLGDRGCRFSSVPGAAGEAAAGVGRALP